MNRIKLTACICIILFLVSARVKSQTVDDENEKVLNGVWWTSSPRNATALKQQFPFIKGGFWTVKWSELEPTPGNYNWYWLDSVLKSASLAGIKFGFIIYTGPGAPDWLYSAPYNVPFFTGTDNTKYPDYLNSDVYIARWHSIIDAALKHIKNDLPAYNSSLVYYNSGEGCTGDEDPFKGTRQDGLLWPYKNSSPEWINFRWEAWKFTNSELIKYFNDASRPSQSRVSLVVNPGNGNNVLSQNTTYLRDSANGLQYSWVKAGHAGHGYQINDETTRKLYYNPIINDVATACRTQARSRSEMDETDHAWFTAAPKWNFYWLALGSMAFGLDTWVTSYDQMLNPDYTQGFNIYDKYAGYKSAACTDKGFCAMRDGLDAADTVRFPVSEYGSGTLDSFSLRAANIVTKFISFGAKQEDPIAADGRGMNQRNAQKMNDVGWNVFAGNYESFVTQINAPTGLYRGGYWRQGALDSAGKPADPYGRYVKAFDPTHKITDYYFDIDNQLNLNTSDNRQTFNAHLRITYYNTHHGLSWQLIYYVKENGIPVKKTYTVKTDAKALVPPTWQVLDIDINNLYIDNKIAVTNGAPADLQLHNNTKAPQGFHLVEISNQGAQLDAVQQQQVAADNASRISMLSSAETMQVYPNPSSGLFNISWNLNAAIPVNIQVINTAGIIIYTKNNYTGNKMQLNLAGKTSGIYFIKIVQNSKEIKTSLVLQQ